jgi:hypothetical protein
MHCCSPCSNGALKVTHKRDVRQGSGLALAWLAHATDGRSAWRCLQSFWPSIMLVVVCRLLLRGKWLRAVRIAGQLTVSTAKLR